MFDRFVLPGGTNSMTVASRHETDDPGPDDVSVEELIAFIGVRSDYYLQGRHWNWAAFFMGPAWLMYRRMYGDGLKMWVVFQVAALIPFGGILVLWFLADRANTLYEAYAVRRILRLRESGLQGDAYLRLLAVEGGTSVSAALLMLMALAVSLNALAISLMVVIGK